MDALPVNKVGIDRGHYDQDYDDVVDVQEAEDSMAGCPAPADPEPQEAEQEIEDRTMDFMCDKCRAVISRKVWEYSRDKYGRPLCMKCQRGAERI